MDEEQGIYRDEVILMLGALADINVNVSQILEYIERAEGHEEEEEDPPTDG